MYSFFWWAYFRIGKQLFVLLFLYTFWRTFLFLFTDYVFEYTDTGQHIFVLVYTQLLKLIHKTYEIDYILPQ